MQMPAAASNFKTKHLDVWVNADQAWMDMRAWDRCADPGLSEIDFEGQDCTEGTDLASKIDIAARAKVFWRFPPSFRCGKPASRKRRPDRLAAVGTKPPTERHFYGFVTSLPARGHRRERPQFAVLGMGRGRPHQDDARRGQRLRRDPR
jgi:hypothetical protein